MKNKIRTTITVPVSYEITKEGVVCKNMATFFLIWGSKTTPSDANIKRLENNNLLIRFEQIDTRLEFMENRKKVYEGAIKNMNELKEKAKAKR